MTEPGDSAGATDAVRVLRLRDMILSQRGTFARLFVHAVISVALGLFFRRVETSGAARVPASGPLVFASNHPNGLIDPALVFVALPRRVSFLAKSTLFRLPVVGTLMRVVEALPVYRRIDEGEDVAKNIRTFRACRELLARGRCIALFPEGVSHNATQLLPLRTGAARIALGAASVGGDEEQQQRQPQQPPLRIMPVGLYYTSKTSFRSEALISFGELIEVQPVELDERGEPPREAVLALSQRIAESLRAVTLNTETEEELEEVKKAEQLFSSIYEGLDFRGSVTETFRLLRRLTERLRHTRAESPERIESLRRRVLAHEEELRANGITPEGLSISAHTRWHVVRHFILRSVLLIMLSPLAVVGGVIHFPIFLLSNLFARLFQSHGPDDAAATVKILAAIFLTALTWLVVSVSAGFVWGWRVGLIVFPSTVVCGYAALRVFEELFDMRGWFSAVLVLLRRRGLFLRLLLERRALHREIEELVGGEGR